MKPSSVDNAVFLTALARDLPDKAMLITCSFQGDPFADEPRNWMPRAWAPGSTQWGRPRPVPKPGFNNYVAISSFYRDEDTDRYRRVKPNFAQLHCVMVDDIGTKVPRSKIKLPTSATVETSPKNYQSFYLIEPTAAASDRAVCEQLLDALVKSGLTSDGRDPGMKGVTRVARLPVGVNGKAKYLKDGQPYATRCTQWNPERRYTIEQLAKAYKLDLTPQPERKYLPVPPLAMKRFSERFQKLLRMFDEHEAIRGAGKDWIPIVCPWVHEHTGGAETGTALAVPSKANGWQGGFRCHHGHCDGRTLSDILRLYNKYRAAQRAKAVT